VVDGVVYVGSSNRGTFYALDAATGTERWRFATDGVLVSSPAVADGVVYVGNSNGTFYALEAGTGAERWRFATRSYADSSPAVAGGLVYVASSNDLLYALDAATGIERWCFDLGSFPLTSPAIAGGTVYVGGGNIAEDVGILFALDTATGQERWRFAADDSIASPAVVDGLVYVGSDDGTLYALEAGSGRERWRLATGGRVSSAPAVVDGVVFVGAFAGLFAIAGANPTDAPGTGAGPAAELARWQDMAGRRSGPDFGTVSGELVQQTGTIAVVGIGRTFRDFYARVRFANPSDGSEWDFGFGFRHQAGNAQYRLIVASDGTWTFMFGADRPLAGGTLAGLDISAGGANELGLAVVGGVAHVELNGGYVASLDVARFTFDGDVWIGTGFHEDTVVPGRAIGYAGFAVWSLEAPWAAPPP
jgi:hypothetical protein